MALKLYNTLTRSLEPFTPLEEGKARVYGCGPTIYDHAHIGNFRTFVAYDLLHRHLEASGFDVRFVVNLTDVDDKTIDAAAAAGLTVREYTEPFRESFLADLAALGIRPFDAYPRATEYVDRMIALVERLMERDYAYSAVDGSIYFPIAAFPGYGKLSRMDPDQVRPGARVAVDEYEKEDARDFALWKSAKGSDEVAGAAWDSPWGRGRPGWHLECSAMSIGELGETLDIHLGGEDLVFPHHEDEIAQSEGATGKPFARYWLHVKHLVLEGRKMSKSLGNSVTVRELVERGHDPAAIRHQLLSAQYRSELNFTVDGLQASAKAIQRLLDFESRLESAPPGGTGGGAEIAARALDRFQAALDSDLNSADALGALFVFVNETNALLEASGGSVSEPDRRAALEALRAMDSVLGLIETAKGSRTVDADTERWVEERIEARRSARAGRDFAAADAIRDELAAAGVVLEDTAEGTRWKIVAARGDG